MPVKAVDPDLSDITALASFLKNRKARDAFQTALKKGKSPTISLTAAISASLVSAAAKEEEFDPLDGLTAVDDLSAFSELCLPGEAYADAEHDHEGFGSGDDHDGHQGHASYLADPFASRFANVYAREHEGHSDAVGHEGHDGFVAAHAAHMGEGAQGASHTASHAGHAGQHGAHQTASAGHDSHHESAGKGDPQVHAQHGSAQHGDHADHVEHAVHDGSHDVSAHQSMEHGDHGAHQSVDASVAHTEHSSPQAASHDMPTLDDDVEDDVIDVDQSIDALAQNLGDVAATDSSEDVAEAPVAEAPDEHHHHATLVDLDTPPADDLAAAAPPPVI